MPARPISPGTANPASRRSWPPHPVLAKAMEQRGQRYVWQLHHSESREAVEVEVDPIALRGMLEDGQGIMLANEFVTCMSPEARRPRRILEGWEGPEVELNAVFPGGSLVSPKVRTFVDFVVERMRITVEPAGDTWQPPAHAAPAEEEQALA